MSTPFNLNTGDTAGGILSNGSFAPAPAAPQSGMFDNGNILNMSPAKFASMAGGLGANLSKQNSLASKMGAFAQGLGNQQLAAIAAKTQATAHQQNLKELLKLYPGEVAKILAANSNGHPALDTTPKPENNPVSSAPELT